MYNLQKVVNYPYTNRTYMYVCNWSSDQLGLLTIENCGQWGRVDPILGLGEKEAGQGEGQGHHWRQSRPGGHTVHERREYGIVSASQHCKICYR